MRRTVFVSALGSIWAVLFVAVFAGLAFAAHPLITDDTGTQGSGKLQLEVNGEYANDNGNSETTLGATLSAGVRDTVDIILGVPYVFFTEEDDTGDRVHENCLSDMSLELKWRFYEQDGLSFALKPGVAVDTGTRRRVLVTESRYLVSILLQPGNWPHSLSMRTQDIFCTERECAIAALLPCR